MKEITSICLLTLMFSVLSCTSEKEHELENKSKNEQIYLAVKSEMQAGLKASSLRIYSETDIENSTQDGDMVSVPTIIDYMAKIDRINVTQTTKLFLYNLPLALIETPDQEMTIDDINSYSIPQSEKELMIQAIAMIDAIKESEIYYTSSTKTRGVKEYEQAIQECLEDYYEGLGIAVGEAVIAGGLGAFGGPAAAGVSCAVVGVWNVGKAYFSWRKCKSRAKKLL